MASGIEQMNGSGGPHSFFFHHEPRTFLAGEGGLGKLVHVLELLGGQPLTV